MMFNYHFEWDATKALSNQRKHGVSFETAATVFNDPLMLSIPDTEHSENEERWLTMGLTQNRKTLVVIHTYRIRIDCESEAIHNLILLLDKSGNWHDCCYM